MKSVYPGETGAYPVSECSKRLHSDRKFAWIERSIEILVTTVKRIVDRLRTRMSIVAVMLDIRTPHQKMPKIASHEDPRVFRDSRGFRPFANCGAAKNRGRCPVCAPRLAANYLHMFLRLASLGSVDLRVVLHSKASTLCHGCAHCLSKAGTVDNNTPHNQIPMVGVRTGGAEGQPLRTGSALRTTPQTVVQQQQNSAHTVRAFASIQCDHWRSFCGHK